MSEEKPVEFASSIDQIFCLLRASVPIIWVTTYEEQRFLANFFHEVSEKQNKELWQWSTYHGHLRYNPEQPLKRATGAMEGTWQPVTALEQIDKYACATDKKGAIFVMKDFHTVLSQPVPRMLRDLYVSLIATRKTILILTPYLAYGPAGTTRGLEPSLDKQITVVSYELPSKQLLETRIQDALAMLEAKDQNKTTEFKLKYTPHEYHTFAMALQGLTEIEADNAVFTSLRHLKHINEAKLLLEKKRIIQRSEILEYVSHSTNMNEVGGLDLAKAYFDAYSDQFTEEAQKYGVEPLKGVLLTGVPGSGKSLVAKSVAHQWNLPLIRLDIGKVMGGLVGQSEMNMRSAINQIESMSPAVCWVDEIEKALSGTKSSNNSDGGTLSRVFGTLLTAMEEGMKGVVIIATANNIEALPPELIRRFNEVMFVDLPYPVEREEIFKIHLKKRGRDFKKLKLNMSALVAATHLFTGSEIEKVVKESIARAYRKKEKDVTTEILLSACSDTKPIATVMKEQIDHLREWARTRARYASSLAAEAAAPGAQQVYSRNGKALNLAEDLDNLDEVLTSKEEEKFKGSASTAQFTRGLDDL